MLDRTLEITHADLVEVKNLCEALRIENEDYQVCLFVFLRFYFRKIFEFSRMHLIQ